MIKIGTFFNYLCWGIWLTVVLFNMTGITHIPWNVALAPMIMLGVLVGMFVIGLLSNAGELKKLMKNK